MSIDTAAKRRNISGLMAGISIVGVTPDSAKPLAWRQQAGWGYSGVPVGAPVVVVTIKTNYFDAVPFTQRYKTRTQTSTS